MAENWQTQLKAELDAVDSTNVRVTFVWEDSKLTAVKLQPLPLSLNITYKIVFDALSRNLKIEKLV